MSQEPRTILVTGGAGFIGSEFVRQTVKQRCEVAVVDKLTYAGDLARLKEVEGRYKFYKTDICDKNQIELIFKKEKPGFVVHFAAETHVDRSINDPFPFIETNIKGTQALLDVSRRYNIKKFIHISTDEVYGEIKKGSFSELFSLQPNSPYSSSKASADLLIRSYVRTYKTPAIIVRPCNNYGPWQYPEKFIPLAVLKLLRNKKIPVYGKGQNIREWLYVSDCAAAILRVLKKGKIGEIYNLGSGQERKNIEIAKEILKILAKPKSFIKFVKDRPGHDFRYSLNTEKLQNELGWQANIGFKNGLKNTVNWCVENKEWMNRMFKKNTAV